jgi:hypothetical protein
MTGGDSIRHDAAQSLASEALAEIYLQTRIQGDFMSPDEAAIRRLLPRAPREPFWRMRYRRWRIASDFRPEKRMTYERFMQREHAARLARRLAPILAGR